MFRRHALLLFVGGMLLCTPLISSATTTLGISPDKIVKPVIRTLDSTGNVGAYNAIAIGRNDVPVIAYYDTTNQNLKFLACGDRTCSSSTIRTLDSTGDVGQYVSVAIGSDGYPIMSYWDGASNYDLKFIKCGDLTCSSTTIRSLDTSNYTGQKTSIAIGRDGYPIISYTDTFNMWLKFVKCNDISCSSNTVRTIDSSGTITYLTSIKLGTDGYPIISYARNGSDLRYAKCNDSSCSAPTLSTLDTPGNAPVDPSMTIGRDGYPVISYHFATTQSLRFLKCNDIACSSPIIRTLDDSANDIGYGSAVVIGRDGYPIISYFDGTAGDAKFYKCNDPSCSTGTIRTLDTEGYISISTSITIGHDGYPVVSYYNSTAGDLKFAYVGAQTKLNTTPPPSPKTAGGLVGWWTFDGKDVDWRANKVLDRSGLGNHGAIINMSTSTTGKPGRIGQGLKFDGVDDYIDAGSPTVLNNLSALTLVLWVNPSALSGAKTLIGKDTSSTGGINVGWRFRTNGSGTLFRLSGTMWPFNEPGPTLVQNEWQQLVVTWDGTWAVGAVKFYKNGSFYSQNGSSLGANTKNDDTDAFVYIGSDYGTTNRFNGTLDDVRIYNRILTAQEIKDIYNQTKGSTIGKCGPGPVLDADGNKYSIVQIGTQCWLDRNMSVGTSISSFTLQTNNATTERWCYANNDANCTSAHPKWPDGGLYQWNEAMQYVTIEGARGICPLGWHIPTDAEWHTLESFLKSEAQTCNAGRTATNDCTPAGSRLNTGGNAGFEGNRAGYSVGDGSFSGTRGSGGSYWSSSQNGANAWLRSLTASVGVFRTDIAKTSALSVRCIKN